MGSVMVNLPPDQNERRDRDQILTFDELLAVVLALLGIGSILWWGLSRDRTWLGTGLFSRPLTSAPAAVDGTRSDRLEQAETPGVLPSFRARTDLVTPPPTSTRQGGLPSLVTPTDRSAGAIVPPVTALQTTEVAPETVATDPLLEEAEEAVTPPPLDISDVPETHWAYPFIQDMYEQGYLPDFPSGQFEPDKALTRAELAALLNRAFAADPAEQAPLNFTDVETSYWAADAIDQVVERGFMSGYPDNSFRPDQQVPRYEVLVSLASGLNLALPANSEPLLQPLGNLAELPGWAQGKVAAAAENRLVVNYPEPNQLKPAQTATRAEIVAMIHQAMVLEGKLDPVESEYIVAPE